MNTRTWPNGFTLPAIRSLAAVRALAAINSLAACAFLAAGAVAVPAVAAEGHAMQTHAATQKMASGPLVQTVREATRRYRQLATAEAEGYALHFGCVSSPDEGAMGLHYVNMDLVGDGELDAQRPEIVIYEPLANGRVRLIGADYLVLAEPWHARNEATPQLGGQLLHLISSPNRYGLPDFYTLHVWAWKPNRHGTFTNWHPDVSCEHFAGAMH